MINLIWDLDGTLIDSEHEIVSTIIESLTINNIKIDDNLFSIKTGPPLEVILRNQFSEQELSNEILIKVISSFRNRYDNSTFDKTTSFMGINEIINNSNYNHYIITNKPDKPTIKITQKLGWFDKVKKIITPYTFDPNNKKSKTELFQTLIESEKLDQSCTYGIGDMETDYIAANNSGLKTIGVLWGTGTSDELQKCTYTCKTVVELTTLLETL